MMMLSVFSPTYELKQVKGRLDRICLITVSVIVSQAVSVQVVCNQLLVIDFAGFDDGSAGCEIESSQHCRELVSTHSLP